jgi:hypothetical protein
MGRLRIIQVRLGAMTYEKCRQRKWSGNLMNHSKGSIVEQRNGDATSNREYWCTVIQQA